MRVVWQPEDTANLRQMAEQFPREVGESAVLMFIVEAEGVR